MNDDIFDYPFIRYPRVLIDNPMFSHISIEARTLLAMILDRINLSTINSDRFTDENGKIYVVYTVEEVSEKLGCGNTRTLRIFKELESNGLIIRSRKICCMPYRIYITERFSEYVKQEFANAENDNSRVHEIKTTEFTKPEDSKNNNSNNEISNTYPSIIGFGRTEDEIREQIEYEYIVCDANRELLDEIVMIMSDILNGTSPTVKIGKDEMPRGIVIARFCKLDSEHILNVLSTIKNNTSQIKNIKQYLITMLYNEPATTESRVTAEFAYYHKIS
ncbi:MAG: replication initiator protein A [Clostridia bacterium]|nr:replication initiator protein A [Clostridia bacterium]